jgi:hypothetical protein
MLYALPCPALPCPALPCFALLYLLGCWSRHVLKVRELFVAVRSKVQFDGQWQLQVFDSAEFQPKERKVCHPS